MCVVVSSVFRLTLESFFILIYGTSLRVSAYDQHRGLADNRWYFSFNRLVLIYASRSKNACGGQHPVGLTTVEIFCGQDMTTGFFIGVC